MSATTGATFEHVFVPGDGGDVTLLLLHGTGGSEHDLLPLGAQLLPGAALLSPRGQVLERGMPRFFKRIAEGVFDLPDLQARADSLAQWVRAQVAARAAPPRVIAVGFSNGANIAAAMLLRDATLLHAAVLFRAMVPYEPEVPGDLRGVRVLIAEGKQDPLITVEHGERLGALFREAGADVTLAWQAAGHGLVAADVDVASVFLARVRDGDSVRGL